MSRVPEDSVYGSRGFRNWKMSILSSSATNSAWAARWYAAQAAELVSLTGLPGSHDLAEKAREAAWHAARDAGMASAEYEKCRNGEAGDHHRAWERARSGANWCAVASAHLERMTELVKADQRPVVRNYPRQELRFLLDNSSTHETPEVVKLLDPGCAREDDRRK